MTYQQLWRPLTALYDEHEAQAVARLVLEQRFGLTLADVLCGRTADDADALLLIQRRLLQGEPVQYVLGTAEFCGRRFAVEPGVLIPRPETEVLCRSVVEALRPRTAGGQAAPAPAILDIGTGSGCIACTLAAELPGARVTAWDVSEAALSVARRNARRLGVSVAFVQADILSLAAPGGEPRAGGAVWDVIVSNPPYVCERERAQMSPRVLCHEPALALFVPDDDPLLFYRSIGRYAAAALRTGGCLAVEINRAYGREVCQLLTAAGLARATAYKDQYGNDRIVKAYQP